VLFLLFACTPDNEIVNHGVDEIVSEEPEYISSTCLGGTKSSAQQVDPDAFPVALSAQTEIDGTVQVCAGLFGVDDPSVVLESAWSVRDGGTASILDDSEAASCTRLDWEDRVALPPKGWTVTMEEAITRLDAQEDGLFVATLISAASAGAGNCYFVDIVIPPTGLADDEPVWIVEQWPLVGGAVPVRQSVVHATSGDILGQIDF
jgi:hypothetical protein